MITAASLRYRDAITRTVMIGLYIGNLILIGLVWFANQKHLTSIGTDLTAIGGLAGLIGAFLILMQIVLMSRLDWLEAAFGRDELAKFHRLNGYAALYTLIAHGLFLTIGYAVTYKVDVVSQFVSFFNDFTDVNKSIIAFVMFATVVVMSVWIVRRRLAYEFWYAVHLTAYLAVALAFSHQLAVGVDFVGHPLFVDYWYLLYTLTFGFLIIYRFITPLYRSLSHGFVVHSVVAETSSKVSIYVTGKHMAEFRFRAGQFANWYFLDPKTWWQGHPFSFSEGYNGRYLRLTVKDLGNYTHKLQQIKPGTRVLIDGPAGHFVSDLRKRDKILLIGGGVGVTPLRAMMRELAPTGTDIVLIYAMRDATHLAFKKELAQFATFPNVRVELLFSDAPDQPKRYADAENLTRLVPDLTEREVYLCGPDPMMDSVTDSLVESGLAKKYIHTERFAY